jgi:hypothetical protein
MTPEEKQLICHRRTMGNEARSMTPEEKLLLFRFLDKVDDALNSLAFQMEPPFFDDYEGRIKILAELREKWEIPNV